MSGPRPQIESTRNKSEGVTSSDTDMDPIISKYSRDVYLKVSWSLHETLGRFNIFSSMSDFSVVLSNEWMRPSDPMMIPTCLTYLTIIIFSKFSTVRHQPNLVVSCNFHLHIVPIHISDYSVWVQPFCPPLWRQQRVSGHQQQKGRSNHLKIICISARTR